MGKKRADLLLVETGLAENRSRAQAYIMAGIVFNGEKKVEKPGQQINEDTLAIALPLLALISASFARFSK